MEDLDDGELAVVTDVIRRRRTLKPAAMDADREVDDGLLRLLLENAIWAPSHGLTQPWRFVVFRGDARMALASRLQEVYLAEVPAESCREDKLEKLASNPMLAPVVIALGVSPRPGGKIPVREEFAAVACAAQNLMLSATAVGLGSFWSSPPILASRSMGEFFGWNEPLDECIGLLYLGWPREGVAGPVSSRESWDSKVSWREGPGHAEGGAGA